MLYEGKDVPIEEWDVPNEALEVLDHDLQRLAGEHIQLQHKDLKMICLGIFSINFDEIVRSLGVV